MNTGKATLSQTRRKKTQKKIDESRILCRPVVEYLRRNHTPYEKVIVDWTSAELFSGELGASYEWGEEFGGATGERKGALTRDDIKVDF